MKDMNIEHDDLIALRLYNTKNKELLEFLGTIVNNISVYNDKNSFNINNIF